MPSHLVARLNLDALYPPFLEKALGVLAACEKRGAVYVATFGYRSVAEQDALYAKGRTKPGPRVTNARGGSSCHNYGIAMDVVLDGDPERLGLQPSWTVADYAVLAEEGRKAGLQVGAGAGLSDPGHMQLPLRGRLKRQEAAVLGELRKAGPELVAGWKVLDALGPW